MNRVELLMHRREIAAWIKSDSINVVLRRRQRVRTPSGAWVWEDLPALPPQRARLVPFKRRLTDIVFANTAGEVEKLPYVLVGDHNFDVKQGDLFTHEHQEYKVHAVDVRRDVRIAAQVDYEGGDEGNE